MKRQLVLVHGRSQQGKDPAALKKQWVDVLKQGLGDRTLPIDVDDVRFPFYGDALIDLMDGRTPDQIVVMGDGVDAEQRVFMQEVMTEVKERAKLTDAEVRAAAAESGATPEVIEQGPQNWGWVNAVARALDHKGFSGQTVALATHDVYCYLIDQGIKDTIDEGVAQAFTPGVETVVVGHSLGSVVAHAVLKDRGQDEGWVVPLYVTVGSPLAIGRIKQSILVPRWPKCLDRWYNARDKNDIVALYPLDAEHFGVGDEHEIENTEVVNQTPNQHGIAGYLDKRAVANVIYEALGGV
ncbi:MAG: hypothetical protein J7518_15180 [Nocardioidaceae bacterium]|nr:hypothetical protein [Nocardioidaceae bacterium]